MSTAFAVIGVLILLTSYLSDMHKQETHLTSDVCNSALGSVDTHDHGEQQFCKFFMDTYNELCKIESKQVLAKSSITIFTHFDVALIKDPGA